MNRPTSDYMIVRFYSDNRRVTALAIGVTLEFAKLYCMKPDTMGEYPDGVKWYIGFARMRAGERG